MIVVDTGVLYALADHSDTHHQACTRWLQAVSDDLIIPSLVITGAAYLIGSRSGSTAEALFLEALAPGGVSRSPSWTRRPIFRASPRWCAPTPTFHWVPSMPR